MKASQYFRFFYETQIELGKGLLGSSTEFVQCFTNMPTDGSTYALYATVKVARQHSPFKGV